MKSHALRKVASAFMLVAFMFIAASPAYAAEPHANYEISPRYQKLTTFYANLKIASNGKASCTAMARTTADCDVELIAELQRNNGNGWEYVTDWSCNGAPEELVSISKSIYVLKGYTYQVKATVYVYDRQGNFVESSETYSGISTY